LTSARASTSTHASTSIHASISTHASTFICRLTSFSYDLVLNGLELGGGGIRIHNAQLQVRAMAPSQQ
jgi:aspartyl-tRNA synthetase